MMPPKRRPNLRVAALSLCLSGSVFQVHAELIDQVDIRPSGQEAEIVIRFAGPVQYQRHAPQAGGRQLQLFLSQPSVVAADGNAAVPETLTQDAPGLLAPISLTYPDLNGALGIRFEGETRWRIKPGPDQRSLSIFVPAAVAVAVSPEAPAWEKEAHSLMLTIKTAATRGDHVAAIEMLNRVLNLPPNSFSEEAQILIAGEREANGDLAKAAAEYALYGKLYPEGVYAAKAKKRLAALSRPASADAGPAPAMPERPARREFDSGWQLSGSLSQNYYRGNSHIEILTPPPPGELTFSRDTLSEVDQSALVSSLDLSYRRRTTDVDSRFVVRDTDTRNFLDTTKDVNRLNAAYFERNDKAAGYQVRAGRQTVNGGGVLGRFDGLMAGYNLGQNWRVNAVAGYPVEYDVDWRKRFLGASLDLIAQPDRLTGSLFAIAQSVEGEADREAVGLELRYFDSRANYFGLIDYDVMFGALNIAMFQGNYQLDNGANLFFLLDHRKSPILELTGGRVAYSCSATPDCIPPMPSLKTMLSNLGADEMERRALLQTPDVDLAQFGFTRQVSPRFQIGADYRLSVTSDYTMLSEDADTGEVTETALPGTGNIHVYSGQLIGNSLLHTNDVGVASLSFIRAPDYDGLSVTLSHVLNLERLRLDSILGYYAQDDASGKTLRRWSPVLRASYRVRERWYVESELGLEDSVTVSSSGEDSSQRTYFFVGYRWEW